MLQIAVTGVQGDRSCGASIFSAGTKLTFKFTKLSVLDLNSDYTNLSYHLPVER